MSRTSVVMVVFVLLPLATGCYTKVAVRFGNGTAVGVRVQSSETGQQFEVAASRFKRIPHSSGDLIVTAQSDERFRFQRVAPFDVDRKYHTVRSSIFGPNSVTLSVKLETNMQLYVVMPGKDIVDDQVGQPTGYPKVGQKLKADAADASPSDANP